MKKRPTVSDTSAPEKANNTTHALCAPTPAGAAPPPHRDLTKLERILRLFADGLSLNRLEAERLGDHCLNSTVSTLSNRYGIKFERKREEVLGRFSDPMPTTRYSLGAEARVEAERLLHHLAARRAPATE